MKAIVRLLVAGSLFFAAEFVFALGTFVFDQQSSDEMRVLEGSVGSPGQEPAQSFTPTLDGLDFVRLWIVLGNSGQRLAVNLRSGSPSGPILGTSTTMSVPTQSFTGALTFLFPDRVALMAGTTYYLQPFPVGGGGFVLNQSTYAYPGGSLFVNGQPNPLTDIWFREGIVVPEPGTTALLLVGGSLLLLRRYRTRA